MEDENSVTPLSISRQNLSKEVNQMKEEEEDVMRKALPINKTKDQRILDLLIDPLCPLSLKKVRGI